MLTFTLLWWHIPTIVSILCLLYLMFVDQDVFGNFFSFLMCIIVSLVFWTIFGIFVK